MSSELHSAPGAREHNKPVPATKLDLPRRLGELPTPPEVVDEVEAHRLRYGRYSVRGRAALEDMLKLQYYFGGQIVAALSTPAGLVILAAGLTDPERVSALVAQQRERGEQITLLTPARWREAGTEMVTPSGAS